MSTRARRRYSEEFKREAVRLVTEQGYPQQQVARNPGIDRSLVGRWRREFAEGSGPAAKVVPGGGEQEELRRLRGEVRQLRMERDILKKALACAARPSSPRNRTGVRVHRGGEGALSGNGAVPGAGGQPQWVLCVAPAGTGLGPPGQTGPDGPPRGQGDSSAETGQLPRGGPQQPPPPRGGPFDSGVSHPAGTTACGCCLIPCPFSLDQNTSKWCWIRLRTVRARRKFTSSILTCRWRRFMPR